MMFCQSRMILFFTIVFTLFLSQAPVVSIHGKNIIKDVARTCLKKGYNILHPVEIAIWGHDGAYPLTKQNLPCDINIDDQDQNYDFFPFQENIWSHQESIITLNEKIHYLEKKLNKTKSEKRKINYVESIEEKREIIVTLNNEIEDWKKELSAILETGEIIALKPLGSGVHSSFVATLTLDNIKVVRAVLKPDRELDSGADSAAETAAYELDQLLDFRMVPMVKQRTSEVNGKKFSLQYFVEDGVVAKKVPEFKQVIPARVYRFDYLIKQWDREDNPGNYLYLPLLNSATGEQQVKVVAIDHGNALNSNDIKHYFKIKKIFDLNKGKIEKFLDSDYDQYLKIKNLKEEDLIASVPHLKPEQRKMILRKREHFIYKTEKLMWRKRTNDEVAFFKDLKKKEGKLALPSKLLEQEVGPQYSTSLKK